MDQMNLTYYQYLHDRFKLAQDYGFDPKDHHAFEEINSWLTELEKLWKKESQYDPYTVFPQFKPQRIKEINRQLNDLLQEERNLKAQDSHWATIQLAEIEKIKTKLNREKMRLDPPAIKEGFIGTEEVSRAKLIPISGYLEFRNKKTKCLWHSPDNHPSLHYYERENIVKCFSCGFRGDAVDVVQKLYDISFIDAVKRLSQ